MIPARDASLRDPGSSLWSSSAYLPSSSLADNRQHCTLRLEWPEPVEDHVLLGDEHGHAELLVVDEGGEVVEGAHVVDLVLDGRRHEGGEPPARHLGPHGRVHHHERLQEKYVRKLMI